MCVCILMGIPYAGMYAACDDDVGNPKAFRTKAAIEGTKEFAR